MKLSVIIPALNEENLIARAIRSAWDCGANEVIVADGGSRDQTIKVALQERAHCIESPPGRGSQLNRGAGAASGNLLLFLHADNWLASACLSQIESAIEQGHSYCCFRQRIDAPSWVYRLIEKGNAIRAKYQRLPYGDQGVLVTRELFDKVKGFEEIPLMEDVSFAKKAALLARPVLLDGPIHVSKRRWEKNGPIRQTLSNWYTMLKYRLGASPNQLAAGYYRKDCVDNPNAEEKRP